MRSLPFEVSMLVIRSPPSDTVAAPATPDPAPSAGWACPWHRAPARQLPTVFAQDVHNSDRTVLEQLLSVDKILADQLVVDLAAHHVGDDQTGYRRTWHERRSAPK